ncbi:MAG: glycosyltransferase family 4 protein [Deltaproteobacteria bacterium]|nr:glycosyltransferase family 4 protein [Deltaproteobacteria bacterium]
MGKRIAMVAYTHYTTDARPRRAAEALTDRGDQVDFFALSEAGRPPTESIHGVNLTRLDLPRYRGADVLQYLRSYLGFFGRAFLRLTAAHLRERYDVVYVHTMPDAMAFVGLPARLSGARLILDVHDTMPELYESKFGLKGTHPLIRALKVQEQLSCRAADHVICVNGPHQALLIDRGVDPAKLTVVMNLPDPRIFGGPVAASDAEGPEGPPRLVYHGTVARRLGLDLAVLAFAEVLPEFPQARFDIYGSGDAGLQLTKVIAELGLQASVTYSNKHFEVDAIPEMVRSATVGVIPNRDDPATRYMLPVKLLEYVYLGIPTVAPRLMTIQHYFDEESVAYYNPGDVQGMAAAIKEVLGSKERRSALRLAAAAFARAHSWDRVKDELYAAVDGD